MLLYWPAYITILAINQIFFPLTIKGRNNIPRKGAFILACNHLSNLDPPLVSYAANRPIYHMAKESLYNNKIFAWVMRELGSFPINREGPDIGAMRECLRKLKAGTPIALFPTGTRVSENETKAPKSGVGFIAVKSGVPVIPLKISGTDKVMGKGEKKLHRHRVTMIIGKPIHFDSSKDYNDIATEILHAINSLQSS